MIVKLIVFVLSWFELPTRCVPGWYVSGNHTGDGFVCVKTPPRAVCDTKAGCGAADSSPDPRYPLFDRCTDKQIPVVTDDARSLRCIRKPRNHDNS